MWPMLLTCQTLDQLAALPADGAPTVRLTNRCCSNPACPTTAFQRAVVAAEL